MKLSNDLIAQFVKLNKKEEAPKGDTTMYGVAKVDAEGNVTVRFDGSEIDTPATTTVSLQNGDRVTAIIKNHAVVITGNKTAPAIVPARPQEGETPDTVLHVGTVIGEVVTTDVLIAEQARVDALLAKKLQADSAEIVALQTDKLDAESAVIKELQADKLDADSAIIKELQTDKLDADSAIIKELQTDKLDADSAIIKELQTDKLDADSAIIKELQTDKLDAESAIIKELQTDKLDAESAKITYANIDFSNIGKAAMEYFYATSGLIKDVTVGDQTITGSLVGVTISGDLIEGNTIKAEKLVVKGSDGLYYKLNFESGNFTDAEEVPDDGLHGSVIIAKSIAAEKISVSDLVAFGATIGGLYIADGALYSGAKKTVGNTTTGLYFDKDGQMALGDGSKYIKYYIDSEGNRKLEIAADTLVISSGKTIEETLGEYTTKQEFENLSVGGRNLIAGTSLATVYSGHGTGDYYHDVWTGRTIDIPTGEEYIVSFDAKADVAQTIICYFYDPNTTTSSETSTGHSYWSSDGESHVNITTEWKRYWVRWTQTAASYAKAIIVGRTHSTDTIYIRAVKLEAGNKATDWSPAPEDVASDIDAVEKRVAKTETDIITNAEEIELRAKKTEVTETLGGYYTKKETEAKIEEKAESITSTVSSTYTTKQEFADLEVGGRNLLVNTSIDGEPVKLLGANPTPSRVAAWTNESGVFTLNFHAAAGEAYYRFSAPSDITLAACEAGKEYTISGKVTIETTSGSFDTLNVRSQNYVSGSSWSGGVNEAIATEDSVEWINFKATHSIAETATGVYFSVQVFADSDWVGTVKLKDLKLEKGNKATDWTPAPEDVNEDIGAAQATADDAVGRLTTAESTIKQLADSIAALVRSGDSGSLVKQDANGLYYFDVSGIEDNISDTAGAVDDLDGLVKTANGEIDVLKSTAKALESRTEYVRCYTDDNDQPCIELGEGDSTYKVYITNTGIKFADGSDVPAYIGRQMLIIEKAMVRNELQLGDDDVGGRNLIAGTSLDTVYSGYDTGAGYCDVWGGRTIGIPTGEEYIVSFDAKADAAETIICHFYDPNTTLTAESSTGQTSTSVDGYCQVNITTEWKRYWVRWTQSAASYAKAMIVGRTHSTSTVYIRAVKLEAGRIATPWSPAPEDDPLFGGVWIWKKRSNGNLGLMWKGVTY